VPITAKLSRNFHGKLGDDAANELVSWLNTVDEDLRSQLRELNEQNFARFDAKLDQRFSALDKRFAAQDERFAALGGKFAVLEERLDGKFSALDWKFTALEERFATHQARIDGTLATFESRMIRWMFIFWSGTMVSTVGLVWAIVRR
jgi:hypothetical protein